MPTAATPGSRGQRRRRELLDAALRVVGREGVAALTHRRMAAEAGIPAGSTTYYFPTRDALVDAALRHAATREVDALEARATAIRAAGLTPAGWADALVDWLADELAGDARTRLAARYALQLEAAHRPALREAYDAWTRAAFAVAERMLAAAGSRAPAADAAVLLAAMDGMRLNQLARFDSDPAALRPVLEHLMRRLLAG